MQVFIKENPRTIAIVSNNTALILRHVRSQQQHQQSSKSSKTHSSSNVNSQPKCTVDFCSINDIILDDYRELSSKSYYGFLGFQNVSGDVFVCFITGQQLSAVPRIGESIMKITSVEFYCLTRSDWDNTTTITNGHDEQEQEHPCRRIKKLLSKGEFYFSSNFDITNTLQDRGIDKKNFNTDQYNESFLWNSFMLSELLKFRSHLVNIDKKKFDSSNFITTIMRGYSNTINSKLRNNVNNNIDDIKITIISKVSYKRLKSIVYGGIGSTGINDEGYSSNFVETEIIFSSETILYSFIQIRGSIPLFWDIKEQLLNSKIIFTRSIEATQRAFDKHFEPIIEKYNSIYILCLLNLKGNEGKIFERYEKHVKSSNILKNNSIIKSFNNSSELIKKSKIKNDLKYQVHDSISEFGVFYYDFEKKSYILEQTGIFRTCCLDGFEKSNIAQQLISAEALDMFLGDLRIPTDHSFWIKHNSLWVENNLKISKIFSSSSSSLSNSSNKFKQSIADVTKKTINKIDNNKNKYSSDEYLMGQTPLQTNIKLFDPINENVNNELKNLEDFYISKTNISIFTGTFNVGASTIDIDITNWLYPPCEIKNEKKDYDIVFIGLQEVVELAPGKMIKTDTEQKLFWEKKFINLLNLKNKYFLIWSSHLGGIVLLLFIKHSQVKFINNIEGDIIKTGMGGMGSNKGGIAVRFDYSITSFCFLTSHLAAGLNNSEDRHNDYKTIAKGIHFSRSFKKTIQEHDNIIWIGDFNYRLFNLSNDQVQKMISKNQLIELFEKDQLNKQMVDGESFPFFNEMEINFPPTYKFDVGTDNYDTSEKQRIPAWCDRILSRGKNLKQLCYGRVPDIRISDHRPVYGIFNSEILLVDEIKKAKLSFELYNKIKNQLSLDFYNNENGINGENESSSFGIPSSLHYDYENLQLEDYDEKDLILKHGLPPPSSDKKKWWMNGGLPVKVSVESILNSVGNKDNVIINPKLPINPFEYTEEPDFIEL